MLTGKEGEEMDSVDKVISVNCYRDGGTTEIKFINDSEKGEIYVPSSLKERLHSTLKFKGEKRELKKVGYDCAYLFNVWKNQKDNTSQI
jgi:hypothetical protein